MIEASDGSRDVNDLQRVMCVAGMHRSGRLIPNLKVIICLRNPIEVARSLTVRNGTSLAFGLKPWRSYNLAVCSFASKQDHLVTHYEAYFSDPRGELRRVPEFLSIPASDKGIAQACLTATSDLRHHKIPRELLAAQASPQVIGLYSELCAEAGPVFQASASDG